jgi:hypothetical protein
MAEEAKEALEVGRSTTAIAGYLLMDSNIGSMNVVDFDSSFLQAWIVFDNPPQSFDGVRCVRFFEPTKPVIV